LFLLRVSIPLWFDSYSRGLASTSSYFDQSQFHYGSIHTQQENKNEKIFLVSIPLWFDSYGLTNSLKGLFPFGLNSIMVRFIHRPCHFRRCGRWRLNSIMVRFILLKDSKISFELYMSQFHYGSIHTYFPKVDDLHANLSQFHYGSIHTKKRDGMKFNLFRLNSIMVRFIQITAWSLADPNYCLNSIMVRFIPMGITGTNGD